jgi:hypothetical protein
MHLSKTLLAPWWSGQHSQCSSLFLASHQDTQDIHVSGNDLCGPVSSQEIDVYRLRSYLSVSLRFVYSRHFSILFDSCYRQKMFFRNPTSEMWLWIYMINLMYTQSSCVCVQQENITLNLNQICRTYTRPSCIFTSPCATT